MPTRGGNRNGLRGFERNGSHHYDTGVYKISMEWGTIPESESGILSLLVLPSSEGFEKGFKVRRITIHSFPKDIYIHGYRIAEVITTCFWSAENLLTWLSYDTIQTRLREEYNKAVATSGTGESPHQPQTPSVGGTSATVASNPPSGTVQTAPQDERDDREDSDDDRRSVSTAGTDVQ
jgi:hypothetical protein